MHGSPHITRILPDNVADTLSSICGDDAPGSMSHPRVTACYLYLGRTPVYHASYIDKVRWHLMWALGAALFHVITHVFLV